MNRSLEGALLAYGDLLDGLPALDGAQQAEVRRQVTHDDPLLFALVYLIRHMTGADGLPSLSEVHESWIDYALSWDGEAGPSEHRDAFVAPREMGKSTWFFLLLPMWAAATGRVKFAAAFADSATQAEGHLATFKNELDTNPILRADYPDLCRPAKRPRGTTISDNRGMLHTASGFVFAARGIDSGTLGMKVGAQRPDLLILDDVEPGESNYSKAQVEKRLGTITDVVLPLNVRARVCLVGTVTMPESIVHQLVKSTGLGEIPEAWVRDENFRVHHALPILLDEAGTERSVWPEKWPLPYLLSIRHTRSFAKNFMNEPVATDGDYWRPEMFTYLDAEARSTPLAGVTTCLLSLDPAVTTEKSSDYSGLSVVGLRPGDRAGASSCVVVHAERQKLRGAMLRKRVLILLERFPEITHVLVETNQGGDLWREVLHGLPVKVVTKHNTEKKEVRAAAAVNRYERGRVVHAFPLPEAEAEMCAFPKAPNDDIADSISNAVNRLLPAPKKRKAAASAASVAY